MTSTATWTARAAFVVLCTTGLTGVNVGSASAAGSTCTPPGQRPSGPVTTLLEPLLGSPSLPGPLGTVPFAVTGALDVLVCPLLP